MCLQEIALRVQNMQTILDSTVNMIEETYTTTQMSMRILTSTMDMMFIRTPEIIRQNGL